MCTVQFFGEIFEKFNLNLLYRGLGTYPTQVKTILSKGAKNGLKDKGIKGLKDKGCVKKLYIHILKYIIIKNILLKILYY